MTYQKLFGFAIATATATTLACSQAPALPSAPAGVTPALTDAGPDGATLKVTAPTLVFPISGAIVEDDDPDLVIANAVPKFVSSVPLSYVFEVFKPNQSTPVYRSVPIPAGANGRTEHETPSLDLDQDFTWRAYAVYQNQRGPMSGAAGFRTFNRFGVSCSHLPTELAIVQCRRAQFGFLDHHDRVEYVRRIAYDLNRGGFEHRPYGILVKNTGNNCGGYSCDIVCSGQGGGQRQWDVLEDEDLRQAPVWNRAPEIAVRPCEFIE